MASLTLVMWYASRIVGLFYDGILYLYYLHFVVCRKGSSPLKHMLYEQLFFDFLKRKPQRKYHLCLLKDDELSKYCWTRIVYEWFFFLFLLMWAIKPLTQAFDVALHCLAELQEIEREDQGSVSEGEKRWRTGATRSTSEFSGTWHTEMN